MWSIQILWADVWITVQRNFPTRDAAEWAIAKWKQRNECHGDPFRAYSSGLEDEEEPSDPYLHCDQCGKPQWDNGSGKCSWNAGTEFGGCDGRQYRDHDQRSEDEAAYRRELRDQLIDQRR